MCSSVFYYELSIVLLYVLYCFIMYFYYELHCFFYVFLIVLLCVLYCFINIYIYMFFDCFIRGSSLFYYGFFFSLLSPATKSDKVICNIVRNFEFLSVRQ